MLNFGPLASDDFLRLVRSKIEPVESSCLTESQKFLAKKWNLKLPFLPVTTKEEANLFHDLMIRKKTLNPNWMEWAETWLDSVDGQTIFPKLAAQLRAYAKVYSDRSSVRQTQ